MLFTIPEEYRNIKIPEINIELLDKLRNKYNSDKYNYLDMYRITLAFIRGELYSEEIYEAVYPYICRMLYMNINIMSSYNVSEEVSLRSKMNIFEYYVYMQHLPGVLPAAKRAVIDDSYDYIRQVYKLAKWFIQKII